MKKLAQNGNAFGTLCAGVLFWCLSTIQLCSQVEERPGFHGDVETSFQQANRLMLEEDHEAAIDLYLDVLREHETATLNHNLGVAYYLDGNTGMAVLHFERALRMGFASAGTREILSLLRNSEGIRAPRYTLLQRMARSLPEPVWLVLVLGSFWGAMMLGVYIYGLVRRQTIYRDLALLCLMLFVVSCVGCIGLAEDTEHGVLVGDEIGLKVVPTSESEVFLTLKGGEMARHLKTNNSFVFVETSNGVRGWVPLEQFYWVCPRG